MNPQYIRDVGVAKYVLRTLIRQFFKRVLRRGLRFRLPTGLRIHLPADSAFGSEVFVTGADVDCGSEALFARYLDPEGDVIDAGANIGYYTCYLAPLVRHVWAFEPDPRILGVLRRNAAQGVNITVCDRALFSEPGTMKLDVSNRPEVNALVSDEQATGKAIEVSVDTIDDVAASQIGGAVTGIKIDVEGSDLAVLMGARATLRRDQPLVLTEFNTGEGQRNTDMALFSLTGELDYHVFGYVRLPGAGSSRFALCRIDGTDRKTADCKMLFLVPARLVQAFEAEVSRHNGE